jgi:signal transduction histidine kinase
MNRFQRNTLLLILGAMLVAVGQVFMIREQNLGAEKGLMNLSNRIEESMINAQALIAQVDDSIDKKEQMLVHSTHLEWAGYEKLSQTLQTQGVDMFVFEFGQPVFWSTQNFQISPNFDKPIELQKQGNLFVAVYHRQRDGKSFAYVLPLIEAKEISYTQSSVFQNANVVEYSISRNPVENSTPVIVPDMELFYLVVSNYQHPYWFDILFLLGALMISSAVFGMTKSSKFHLLAVGGLFATWLGIYWLFSHGYTLEALRYTPLFSHELFFASDSGGALGELMFITVLGLFVVSSLVRWLEQWIQKSNQPLAGFVLSNLAMQASLWMLVWLLLNGVNLVHLGRINLDFQQFHRLTLFSFIAVATLAVQWVAFYRMNGFAWSVLQVQSTWVVRLISLAQALPPLVFVYITPDLTDIFPYWMGFIAAWIGFEWWMKDRKDWLRVVLRVVFAGILVSSLFAKESAIKEKRTRRYLAENLLQGTDIETAERLKKTESMLLVDKGIVDYYTCTDETKAEFEKRLRELYFGPYLADFEVNFLDFNSLGKSYRQENSYDYPAISQLFKGEDCVPVTTNFVKVNNYKLKGSFIGRFDVSSAVGYHGVFFVILSPRLSSMEGRLSDLFNRNVLEPLYADNQYSFAIYNNNRLNYSYGSVDYPLDNRWHGKFNDSMAANDGGGKGFLLADGVSHFVLTDGLNNTVVLSRSQIDFIGSITGFTVLGLGGILIVMLYYFVIWLRQRAIVMGDITGKKLKLLKNLRSRMPMGNQGELFIANRLQLYVTWMVFATFLVVLFVTVNYFVRNYSETQKDGLRQKANEIASKLSSKVNIDAVYDKYQTGLVYDLAEYYNTDINLYRADGTLLVSTNDRLIEESVRGRLMNPSVYRKMSNLGSSTSLINESLGDLDYISSYTALLNKDLKVKGYLNLPYFSNRKDLYRDISEYAVTIINLFALVFAIMIVIAYLVAQRIALPLNLIRKQLASVKIGERNQPLDWDKNDEIGLLVKEYNKMIVELENSLNLLAESERQGAWREMAKQVAHEIKNPLTPMRLSLQHLQFSLQRNDENLKDKIQKTSELLIRQIDSLAQMAEEFSSFAKMPEPKLERVNLVQVVSDAVLLLGKESDMPIEWKFAKDLVYVQADPLQLGRVFTNILKNAIQSIPEGRTGEIGANLKLVGNLVVVEFKDNGKGIPETLREKIFSPNFSTKNSGMGLGLAISKKIVEQLGGRIAYKTKVGEGTTFTIELPVVQGD